MMMDQRKFCSVKSCFWPIKILAKKVNLSVCNVLFVNVTVKSKIYSEDLAGF